MADSIDRVFVHALSTLKRIPRTGAPRPPPADRLRLYGLYKQAREGDVEDVMARPTSSHRGSGIMLAPEDLQREKDKWDAWRSQHGVGRTEAKRRYIEALIDIMHQYATTPDAGELAAELEFVWSQIKNTAGATDSPDRGKLGMLGDGLFRTARLDGMRILSPMSEQDEADLESERRLTLDEALTDGRRGSDGWARSVERAVVRLSAEVAALREQISTGREWKTKKQRSVGRWIGWIGWVMLKHAIVDLAVLSFVLLWMRMRGDGRLEDLVRGVLRIGREYVKRMLPARSRLRAIAGV